MTNMSGEASLRLGAGAEGALVSPVCPVRDALPLTLSPARSLHVPHYSGLERPTPQGQLSAPAPVAVPQVSQIRHCLPWQRSLGH